MLMAIFPPFKVPSDNLFFALSPSLSLYDAVCFRVLLGA